MDDEVCIDNPPNLGRSPAERIADDQSGKLHDKTTSGYYFLEVRDRTGKVIKDGIEDVFIIDRVTPIKAPLESVTLHPAEHDEAAPMTPPVATEKRPSAEIPTDKSKP